MNKPSQNSSLPKHPTIWWSRVKTKWPFLVWAGAIVLAFYFYCVGVDLAAFVGHVEAVDLPISPGEDSQVETVLVKLGDTVSSNQPIAVMNSSMIDAEIRINEALAAEDTALATDRILSLYNGYQKAISDAESQLSSEVVAQGKAQGELDATIAELARLRKLIEERVTRADSATVSGLITQEASLKQEIRLYPPSIASCKERLARARTELEGLRRWLGIESNEAVTEALVEKVRLKEGSPVQQIALLRQRKEQYTLRAPNAGTVAHLFERPGCIVARGVPIVTVLVSSERVVGFLPELFSKEAETGMPARILRRTGSDRTSIAAVVEALSPRIEGLTVTSGTGNTLRGRRIYLSMKNKPSDLLPGETVDVQLISRQSPWLHAFKRLLSSTH